MRVVSIGGGPGGLFAGILLRKAFPDVRVTVLERNRPDDTFGWGVVFSRETLGHIEAADPETYGAVAREFAYWDDIDTWLGGERVVSTGHGFCGLSRRRLLSILQERARELGVDVRFQTEVSDPESVRREADLVLGADGVQSLVRQRYAEHFRPTVEMGRSRFCWLGTTLPMRAFTFWFRPGEHGLFRVHAYPFARGQGTFILECTEATWRAAGLDRASEPETVAYAERLFADVLGGHRLLSNKSIWRSFPTVRCEAWSHENLVLLGDAVHTAHFSIGSGTKLAMEDAIALVDAFRRRGTADVPGALAEYEAARRPDAERLQRAAAVSRAWFEECERWADQPPLRFTFNLLTRSMRLGWDNLERRDPTFVGRVREDHARSVGAPKASDGSWPVPLFTPYEARGVRLANRVVVSPMCQYSATEGVPGDWHLVHLGSRAVGGAALVIAEATGVAPEGRITPGCTGLWNDAQAAAWRRIVEFVHGSTPASIGVQLAHAGRKGSAHHPWAAPDAPLAEGAWPTLAPSGAPWAEGWPPPREMDRGDMDRVRDQFVAAARRAEAAGFDWVELHMAHGYLLSSFLSPLSNRRTDAYGGSLANRLRFPLEVLAAVRAAWPADRPISVRITASDWLGDRGVTPEEAVEVARALAAEGCDVVDVSSGGNDPESRPVYGRMYQLPFADRIRNEAKVPVMAVGGFFGADDANTALAAGRADLCCLARAHLADPYLTARAAARYGFPDHPWPGPYLPGRPR